MTESEAEPTTPVDWEAFYQSYRKPGYVPGYEITSKLGGGMFGLVFKATKQSIGKDYAIKFLKVDDEDVRRAVVAELESAPFFAQVDHPNLVSIEDRGVVDGIPYIVMAYAGDETLRDRLESGRGDVEGLLRVYLQACRGVQALHEHSLVHFDLKPANIFLKGDVARIGDYGLSKLVAQSRNTLSMGRGTPYYMAPEMLQRKGDTRSDVYSLGVILFEILTGDVPFKGDSEWEVLRKHETATPAYPANMPAEFRGVLTRALAKNPADRFQSAAELVTTLCASAGEAPEPVETPEFKTPPPPGAGRQTGSASGDDPYAEFRKVCRDFSEQAKQMASEAFKNVREASRGASRDARAALGPAMRRHRRVWAARAKEQRRRCQEWWDQQRDWSTWRRRSRPRRRVGTGTKFGLGVVAALFVLAFMGSLLLTAPGRVSSVESSASSEWTASVGDRPSGTRVEIAARSSTAREALADARVKNPTVMKATLAEFRRHVPSTPEQLAATVHELPDYPLALDVSAKSLKKARAEVLRVARADRSVSTARLERMGYPGVLAAVEQLDKLDLSDEKDARAAVRLNAFLQKQLQFPAIVVRGMHEGGAGHRYAQLNAAAPRLWRWFMHDFAWNQKRFEQYRKVSK